MLDMKRVGKNIKASRAKKNMTQLELADIVGVSYQAVSNWERGKTMPDITKIPDIAKALDTEIEDILGDKESSKAVSKVVEEKQELLTTEEIIDIAPILPPQIIKENINNSERDNKLNIKALVELAPYLDEEYLDDLVKEIDVTQINELVKLAPYLSEETLDIIADRAIASGQVRSIIKFAPYFEDDTLKKIADYFLHSKDTSGLSEIAQYM